ncbi:MerR family transcriptional regulator [Actinomadura logoneensis]|uniref:MerR family transcriptional regulator n=1 Tax=Actinomadura logoneensis TaxID=2293572 RepID=A0A372JQV9_9ACTN|nr:MerR family transcriptional regulator [Actinomadura logoneensis]RFU42186.1 MerR family transcriptional regulator [Actinomadura logoneensis]
MSEDLLPIGRFARLCRLSVKRLRHYDDLGLLSPAHVDPASGYRYYRPEQARDALAIGLLRTLDVPLPMIARTLALDDPTGPLTEVRDRQAAELERRRRALDVLERLLVEGLPAPEVTVVDEPARTVALARDTAALDDIAPAMGRCAARLLDVATTEPMVGLFPLDPAEEIPVALAAVLPDGADAPPGTRRDVLVGGPFATALHVGPFDQVGLVVHGLLAWCADHGHTPGTTTRETYLTDPERTPPEALVTRVQIRLEDER